MKSSRILVTVIIIFFVLTGFAFAQSAEDIGAIFGVMFLALFYLALFGLYIYMIIWVAKDAKNRGAEQVLWIILVVFFNWIGLIIYLIARPKGNFEFCTNCGKKKLESAFCPHCGQGEDYIRPTHSQQYANPTRELSREYQHPQSDGQYGQNQTENGGKTMQRNYYGGGQQRQPQRNYQGGQRGYPQGNYYQGGQQGQPQMRHSIPKCLSCGAITQWKLEPILLAHHIIIFLVLLLFFGAGLIYLIIVLCFRASSNNRSKICPVCGAQNLWTFIY